MADANPKVAGRLAEFYNRNGYSRRINAVRKQRDGILYKKGAEIRLVAQTLGELAEIRRLLVESGIKLARPFVKAKQWRQPLYGVGEVARFLTLIGEVAPVPV